MDIKMFHESVLLLIDNKDEPTFNKLTLEDENKARPIMGYVADVGENVPKHIKVGDRVIFSKFAGVDVPYGISGNKKQIIVNYRDILGGATNEISN